MRTISLCCKRGRCPELHEGSDGSISITDDYGGIVTMTKEQFNKLLTKTMMQEKESIGA